MQAFLLERLYPTGWRRSGEIFWRFRDAELESQRAIRESAARGVRVLAVRIHPDAVMELLADPWGGGDGE